MICTTATEEMVAAVTSNRSVASTPTTPNEVRCVTPTMYANTAPPKTTQERAEFTRQATMPDGRSRCGVRPDGRSVVVALGEEPLELGGDRVAARQLAVLVHEGRGQRVLFHIGVVTLFERADETLQLGVLLDLLLDLLQELAVLFTQPIGREDQSRSPR